jgi:hypothetical protein
MNTKRTLLAATLVTLSAGSLALADARHTGGIHADSGKNGKVLAPFDIVHARVSLEDNIATFHMGVAERAGSIKPEATGKLAGSSVFSYVWPTSLNSGVVGFEDNAGILALAVTAHPDFDDTPLYDENADNNTGNDGNVWHSHWVVLSQNEQCGEGALGVVDIPKGSSPRLPKTWPGLPILIDSPGWSPTFNEDTVEVKVAFDQPADIQQASYDGVTAGLRVNQSMHAPLLCVVNVMDVASGDLSLPGKVNQ